MSELKLRPQTTASIPNGGPIPSDSSNIQPQLRPHRVLSQMALATLNGVNEIALRSQSQVRGGEVSCIRRVWCALLAGRLAGGAVRREKDFITESAEFTE